MSREKELLSARGPHASGKTGSGQLVYSTFLGTSTGECATALSVDASGVATVAGIANLTHIGNGDAFVSRLDPRKTGSAQLAYSTYLGGE